MRGVQGPGHSFRSWPNPYFATTHVPRNANGATSTADGTIVLSPRPCLYPRNGLARNQVIFREVNQRLREVADGVPDGKADLCECSSVVCTEKIELRLFEYEAVRARPKAFFILPCHECLEVERVMDVLNVEGSTVVPFLCECADIDCLGRVETTIAEYEDAHAGDDRYFILPRHQRIAGEEILSENGRFEVVSKAYTDKVSRRGSEGTLVAEANAASVHPGKWRSRSG